MTLEELRKMLSTGQLTPSQNDIVAKGFMPNSVAVDCEYSLHCGWDAIKALSCDEDWGKFNFDLLNHIDNKYTDPNVKSEVLRKCSFEDYHWQWFNKSICCNSNEYLWFFLYSEGMPQAACLVFHPKQSILSPGKIFYIEYIAVAPWNRRNVMQSRTFAGVGTRMLKHVVGYCRDNLNLIPGFSLHALPGAMSFYEKIGMLRGPSMDKDSLAYYEMPEIAFSTFIS